MEIDSKTKLLGLLGNPSLHSLSPLIQNHFLSSYSINCKYFAFEPPEAGILQAFTGAKMLGFKGLNITMPFKEEVCSMVDTLEEAAGIIRSVNTVKFNGPEGHTEGYSTDGDGVIMSLEEKGFDFLDKTCLIIGAGGAAKSAVYSLYRKPVKKIYIYDIVYEKSISLVNTMTANILRKLDSDKGEKFCERKIKTSDAGKILEEVDKKITVFTHISEAQRIYESIDLIINCTPAGMHLEKSSEFSKMLPVPNSWDLGGKFIFDMVYNPSNTPFLKKAEKDGSLEKIFGIDMLINQAAKSFHTWFDIMPGENIIKELREKIKNYLENKKK